MLFNFFFSNPTGNSYNLSEFASKDTTIAGSSYDIVFRMCGTVSSQDYCKEKGANSCFVEHQTTTPMFYMSKYESGQPTIKAGPQEKSVSVKFTNGETYITNPVQLEFIFVCSSASTMKYDSDYSTFSFVATIEHPSICGGSSGLSGGWIFIIILLVSIALWLLVGIGVMHKMFGAPLAISSAPGWPLVVRIPGYTADGMKFTYSKIRGLFGRPASGYADTE